jgi:drug/metabolite transporter (DMT)-like permease
VVVAAIGFGTLGPLARFASDAGFSAVSFALWRAGSAVAALVAVLVIGAAIGRVPTTSLSSIRRVEWIQLAAMGAFVAGTTVSLFFAFERTTIATALIVFYTFPVLVALTAVPIYGEHLGGRKAAAIALAGVGLVMLLLSPGQSGSGSIDVLGVGLALVASVCQTGFALVGSSGFRSVPPLQSAALLRLFTFAIYVVILVPLVVLLGQGPTITDPLDAPWAWGLILTAGIVGAAVPAVLTIAGYRRVGPTRGAVLMLMEPVTGVLLASILLAERPSPLQLAGGALVLVGAGLVQLAPVSRPAPQTQPAVE